MWIVDLLLVLPSFLIVAILSPTFRGKTWLVFVVLLAAFLWMVTARIVRGMTISLREREYVLAARYMGVGAPRIIFRHILPNLASLLIIDATINVSAAIISETGLSYFGFGVQPPDVSLGTLIADGTTAATTYSWLFLFPAGLLVAIVLAVNLVGDGLRDALDPTSGGSDERADPPGLGPRRDVPELSRRGPGGAGTELRAGPRRGARPGRRVGLGQVASALAVTGLLPSFAAVQARCAWTARSSSASTTAASRGSAASGSR